MTSATEFFKNLKSSIISKKESYGYTKEEQNRFISDIDEKIKKGKTISISSPDYFHSSEFNGEIWGIGIPVSKEDLKIQLSLEKASVSDCKCKIAIYPFAKGCVRTAYHAKIKMNGSDKWSDMILKEFIFPNDRNEEEYKNQSENSAFVSYLADLYCKTNSCSKNIKGLKSRVIKVKNFLSKSNVLFNMEENLEGIFKKWNNNGGYTLEYNKDLFSFAKWTHKFSDGYLLVADLQGIETSIVITLTDPAILCTDMKRFGVTNLGSSGIKANLEALNKNLNNNKKSASLCEYSGTIRPGKSRIEDDRLIAALDGGLSFLDTSEITLEGKSSVPDKRVESVRADTTSVLKDMNCNIHKISIFFTILFLLLFTFVSQHIVIVLFYLVSNVFWVGSSIEDDDQFTGHKGAFNTFVLFWTVYETQCVFIYRCEESSYVTLSILYSIILPTYIFFSIYRDSKDEEFWGTFICFLSVLPIFLLLYFLGYVNKRE